jgi:hypothetical protein
MKLKIFEIKIHLLAQTIVTLDTQVYLRSKTINTKNKNLFFVNRESTVNASEAESKLNSKNFQKSIILKTSPNARSYLFLNNFLNFLFIT